jgi:hypothetical protein
MFNENTNSVSRSRRVTNELPKAYIQYIKFTNIRIAVCNSYLALGKPSNIIPRGLREIFENYKLFLVR